MGHSVLAISGRGINLNGFNGFSFTVQCEIVGHRETAFRSAVATFDFQHILSFTLSFNQSGRDIASMCR